VFVGGGAEIYKEALPLASTIHLTTIEAEYEGEVLFPQFSLDEFEEVSSERVEGEGAVPYVYRVYARKVPVEL
jgi:dihydrofolate reductase